MIFSPILAVSFIMSVIAVLFLICCIIMILIILIQKGKGGGLSGALAGGMASGLLGTKTGDFLTWVTIGLVGVFLTLAVVMAKFYKPQISEFGTTPAQQTAPQEQPAPQQQEKSELPPVPAQAAPEATETNVPGK
jgi:preprotein translocase subunit SecG